MFNQDSRIEVKEKLTLLYTYHSISIPVDGHLVDNMLLDLGLIEYFPLQQYTAELVDKGLLEQHEVDEVNLFMITDQGINTLTFFEDRINQTTKALIDEHTGKLKQDIKQARLIRADYRKVDEHVYLVDLGIKEGSHDLIRLTLSVPSNKTAKAMCDLFKAQSVEIYGAIIKQFEEDDEQEET